MNKIVGILGSTLALSTIGVRATDVPRDKNIFILSPLLLNGGTTYGYFEFVRTLKATVTIEISIQNAKTGTVSIGKKTFQNTYGDSFLFTYDNSFTSAGLNAIYIDITQPLRKKNLSVNGALGSSNVHVITESNNEVIPSQKLSYFNQTSWGSKTMKYTFNNLEEKTMTDSSGCLELSNLRITSNVPELPIEIEDAYLYILDEDNDFPYISHNGKSAVFKLKSVLFNDNEYGVNLDDLYFVEKSTLKMSEEDSNPNFIKTSKLFFPIFSTKKEYTSMLVINKFGITNDKVTFNFKVKKNFALIGDCVSSDYCISVNDSNVNDLGWYL